MQAFRSGLRVALLVGLSLAAAREAEANGKFPAADQLIEDPGDPTHLVLRTTFGVVTSRNAGVDWDVICEGGVGYSNYEPGVAVTPEGTLIAGLVDGLSVSSADSCGWGIALTGNIQDVSVSRAEPGVSLAIRTDPGVTQYFESADDAASFMQVGVDLPLDFVGITVDVAPSDPSRIYVSGLSNAAGRSEGMIARSVDRGETWELFAVPGSDGQSMPYIGAVDPIDPDILYVRLNTAPGRLLGSTNGGETWIESTHGFQFGVIRGLALSPDGQTILAGSEYDGLWRAPASTLQFEMVSKLAVRCLTWTPNGLYACVNEDLYGDGYIVGRSPDEGRTFDPLLSLACVRGILACPSDSSVGQVCPDQWPILSAQLETEECNAVAGGAGGQGSGGSSASGGTGAAPVAPPADDGCSCTMPGADRDVRGRRWLFAIGVLVAIGLRGTTRRRQRRRGVPTSER